MTKARVQIGTLTGTVTKELHITLDDKKTKVYAVKWDGKPNGVPMMYRDEAGNGTKKGYTTDQLTFI